MRYLYLWLEQGGCCSRILGTCQEDWRFLKARTEDFMHVTEERSVLTLWPMQPRWHNPPVRRMMGWVNSPPERNCAGIQHLSILFQGPGQCFNKILHWPTWTNLIDSLGNTFMPIVYVLKDEHSEGCAMVNWRACIPILYNSQIPESPRKEKEIQCHVVKLEMHSLIFIPCKCICICINTNFQVNRKSSCTSV